MRRGGWYAAAVLCLAIVGMTVAWREWPKTSAGQFDPVSAVLGLASLGVAVAALRPGTRPGQQGDIDLAAVAARLATTVRKVETEARRQLLGAHDRVIDVRFSFRRAPAHDAAMARSQGTLADVADYYRALRPRRMVITGSGGSGKTVLAVELILGLLGSRMPEDPVPVRMPAAALNTARPSDIAVSDWLTEYLQQALELPKHEARALVGARMVLPVIDGLDEMDATDDPGYSSRAGQVIRACNDYLDHSGHKAAVVLTCRAEQYQAMEAVHEWVYDAARIDLLPVGPTMARAFLLGRASDDGRWRSVLREVRRGGTTPLAQALSTPWRLSLAATVYEQRDPYTGAYIRDPDELVVPGLDAPDKIRDHLLALLIPATAAAERRYPADRVHRWLATLASYLKQNAADPNHPDWMLGGRALSETDLVLHELWPLAGTRVPRLLVRSAIGLVPAVVAVVAALFGHEGTAVGVGVLAPAAFFSANSEVWPDPTRLSLRRLRTWSALGNLALGAGIAVPIGIGSGFALGLFILVGGGSGQDAFILAAGGGIVLALFFAPIAGLIGLFATGFVDYVPVAPLDALKSSLFSGLAVASPIGVVAGLIIGFGSDALWIGLLVGLATFLIVWLGRAPHAARYGVLLLRTRRQSGRWLPWRLAQFLQWAYRVGLMRIAGNGYQFRHRELQEYLAEHPFP